MPLLLLSLISVLLSPTLSAEAAPMSKLRKALCPYKKSAALRLLSPALLEESSEEEMLAALENVGSSYGPCRRVEETRPGHFLFEFREASVEAELRFNAKGQLAEFSFGEAEFKNDSFEKLGAGLSLSQSDISLWVEKNGEKVFSHEEDQPLNVSRASFLFVVKALNEAVAKGKVKLSDTTRLQGDAKTVSFGLLHHWADGTLITLDTLKNLVGVENDATAADLLISVLGKEQVEKQGLYLKPLFTNREIARLHADAPVADPPKSREAAAAFLSRLPDSDNAVDFPEPRFDLVASVGWFASAKEMCALVKSLKNEAALRHAYRDLREKGGTKSELEKVEFHVETRDPGVAVATLLFSTTDDKAEHCISFVVNDNSTLNERLLVDVVGRAEHLLLKRDGGKADKAP